MPVPLSCTNLFPVYASPLTVSSSNTIWSSIVDVDSSCVNPPFTNEIFAVAPPPFVFALLKTKLSPIS